MNPPQRCLQAKFKYRNEPKQVMPKSEDLSRSLEINAIWTFDTEFPTIFNKPCTYIFVGYPPQADEVYNFGFSACVTEMMSFLDRNRIVMSDVNFKTRLLEHMAGTIYCQSKTSSIQDGVTDFTSDDQGALNAYPHERTSEYLRDKTDATMIGTHSVFNRNAYFPPPQQ